MAKVIDYNFYKDWFYFRLGGLIEISITNPFKTMKKIKGIFIPLKRKFHHGKRCNIRTKSKIFSLHVYDVGWKDKYDTPRFEESPFIELSIFKYTFRWNWELDSEPYDTEEYWEQALWYLYYYDTYSQGLLNSPNITIAEKSWPWTYMDNSSTWNNKYLIKAPK